MNLKPSILCFFSLCILISITFCQIISSFNLIPSAKDTNLFYEVYRYYDPKLGRFTQPDTVIPTVESIDLNRYAYVRNNPIKYNDPSGHVPQSMVNDNPLWLENLIDSGNEAIKKLDQALYTTLKIGGYLLAPPKLKNDPIGNMFYFFGATRGAGKGGGKNPRLRKDGQLDMRINNGPKPGQNPTPENNFKPGEHVSPETEFKKGSSNFSRVKGPRKKLLQFSDAIRGENIVGLNAHIRWGTFPMRSLIRISFAPDGGYTAVVRSYGVDSKQVTKSYDKTLIFDSNGKITTALEHWDPNIDPIEGTPLVLGGGSKEPVQPHHLEPSGFDTMDWDVQGFVGRRDGLLDFFPLGKNARLFRISAPTPPIRSEDIRGPAGD